MVAELERGMFRAIFKGMTFISFFTLLGVVLGLVALAFAAIGVGIFLGRRKTLQGCACEFNAEKARAEHRAASGCCGGGCGGAAHGAPRASG